MKLPYCDIFLQDTGGIIRYSTMEYGKDFPVGTQFYAKENVIQLLTAQAFNLTKGQIDRDAIGIPSVKDVLTAALNEMRDACSLAVSGDIGVNNADKIMAGVDIGPIVERYAAHPPAVAVLQAELDEWRKLLDPHTLHVNLCRGFPAKLTAEQLLHIAGDEKQQQAVAVVVPEVWRDAMERAAEDLEDNNCLESAHQLRAMLDAAQKGGAE